jgi:hydroxymethylpyrimidine/phosphomethylpyrimidine kinase
VSAVLVIAGTDPSGGAGLTRDVSTLSHFVVEALGAVTAVAVQSVARLSATHLVPAEILFAQMAAALATQRVAAVKIGMLGTRLAVQTVAAALPPRAAVPIVLDPVLVSSSGGVLLDEEGRAALIEYLLPRVTLLTPNIPEAALLLQTSVADAESELIEQAEALCSLGAAAVLLKGGHGHGREAIDYLVCAEQPVRRLSAPRAARSLRGSGGALAAAIAAALASGAPLEDACARAQASWHAELLLRRAGRAGRTVARHPTSDARKFKRYTSTDAVSRRYVLSKPRQAAGQNQRTGVDMQRTMLRRALRGALITGLTTSLAACGGGGEAGSGTATQTTTANMPVLISDASSDDWATIGVRVLSIALVPQGGGSNVTVWTAPTPAPYVNLEQLDQLGEILGNASVPTGFTPALSDRSASRR